MSRTKRLAIPTADVPTDTTPAAVADRPVPVADQIFHPELPLRFIVESPLNPRRRYDAKAMADLEQSIRTRGIDTPVIVREINPTHFELGAGHRRCRAARAVGLTHVPALIRTMTDDEFVELLNVDNLQRADIDPLDEALGYEQLLQHGHTAESLATRLGKSPTYVATRMRLLKLCEAAREALQRDLVPLTHAIELAKLTDDQQHELLAELFNLDPEKLEAARQAALQPAPEAETAEESGPVANDDDTGDSLWEDPEEDGERYDVERTPHAFAIDDWETPSVPTVEETRRFIKTRLLRRLKVVAWDLADATLVPEAGACSVCPKRTGAAPLLFEELVGDEDACTDARCFNAKARRHEEREAAALDDRADDHRHGEGEDGESGDDRTSPVKPAAMASTSDWEEKRRADEAKRRKDRERKQRGRDAAVLGVLFALKAQLKEMPLPVLVTSVLREVHTDALARMLTLFGLETSAPSGNGQGGFGFRLDRLTAYAEHPDRTDLELLQLLVCASLGDETGIQTYDLTRKPERLLAYGRALGVDVTGIAKLAESSKGAPATLSSPPPTPPTARTPAKKSAKKAPKKAAKPAAKKAVKKVAKKAVKKAAKKSAKR